MELEDVVLSTLAEIESEPPPQKKPDKKEIKRENSKPKEMKEIKKIESKVNDIESELLYLNSIKERLLVLFEGFQAPNNANLEAKIDMTLNFLEYILATIESRIDILTKGNR